MMDRRQQHLQLVLLPPALFIAARQDAAERLRSLEALGGGGVQPFIIYQETSDIWINVSPTPLRRRRLSSGKRYASRRLSLPGARHLPPVRPDVRRRHQLHRRQRIKDRLLSPVQDHVRAAARQLRLGERLRAL